MKKSYSVNIAAAVLTGCLVFGGSNLASAEQVMKSSSDVVEVTLYGQVNRAVMYGDNGNDSEVFQVDNINSSSRLGLNGKANVSDTFSTGITFEAEWSYNPSNKVSFADPTVDNAFNLRKFELFLDSKTYGKVSLGQGDTASNSTSEVDLSGTSVAGYSAVEFLGGGLEFYNKDSGENSTTTVGDAFNNMDGLSRQDRLRYDTPRWSGFMLSGSAVEDKQWDVAARYNNKFEGWQIAGAVAYADFGDSKDQTQFNGSISVLLDAGFNATFAAGSIDLDNSGGQDPVFFYTKLGYLTKTLTKAGYTGFSIDYTHNEDIDQKEDEGDEFGVQAVQKVDNWGTEFYGTYRLYQLDRPDTDFDNIYLVMAGARIKF